MGPNATRGNENVIFNRQPYLSIMKCLYLCVIVRLIIINLSVIWKNIKSSLWKCKTKWLCILLTCSIMWTRDIQWRIHKKITIKDICKISSGFKRHYEGLLMCEITDVWNHWKYVKSGGNVIYRFICIIFYFQSWHPRKTKRKEKRVKARGCSHLSKGNTGVNTRPSTGRWSPLILSGGRLKVFGLV